MPCYGNIPEGDEIGTHWADDERVAIFNLLDDLGQPFSCTMWGDAGTAGVPVIIDDGNGHFFHDLFELVLDAYPVNVFIDHGMNVVNITEAEMNQTAVNNVIQSMVDGIPTVINYLDDIQPIFNTSCVTCHGISAGLNLTSYSNVMNGSNNGDVITPLNHLTSVLWQRINSGEMPPPINEDLTLAQIDLIATWINQGAQECAQGEDCDGVCGGDAVEDMCNECDSNTSNDCVQDCNGDWGGLLVEDECGVCGGDNGTCLDCADVPNGASILDMCETCDNDPTNDCVQDCAGVWGGSAVNDDCEVCGGNNSTCTDCNDELNGSAIIDGCGDCVSGSTGLETCPTDCNDVDDGTAWINNCGECVAENDMSCVQGCDGNWSNDGSQLLNDECGICGGIGPELNFDCDGNCLVEIDCNDECGGTDVSCLSIGNQIPESFSINSIYPNPFNPVVNIDYSLSVSDKVDIRIYDLNGQIVEQLFMGNQTVGNYEISWDASNMSSGIYLLTIQSRNSMLSEQLILLK